jgi:SAM-dependent methyltransferase
MEKEADRGSFQDLFSAHAPDYSAFRPTYPEALFVDLASMAPAQDLAWDCATGNGQAALGLASFFEKVVATDASAGQLAHARRHENICYAAALAERSPLADRSVDLVTVAQALHWLRLPAFYAEVRRVARPGCVIACWCYNVPRIAPEIDPILFRLDFEMLRDFWLPGHHEVSRNYATIPFPFEELTAPAHSLTVTWDLPHLTGFLNTWSSARRYRAGTGSDPVEIIRAELTRAWGDPDRKRQVSWPLHLRVGRVKPRR